MLRGRDGQVRRQRRRLFGSQSSSPSWWWGWISRTTRKRRLLVRVLLIVLPIIAVVPPLYLHFSLRRFHQMQSRRCGWIKDPPLVCAHGGDSTSAFPNTMEAYRIALASQTDCIEIDVSRSSDGVLFALHDRELQLLTGNGTSKVGYLSANEIADLGSIHQDSLKFEDLIVPTVEDALNLVSGSVRKVILDAKVGPPLYENGLATDILSVVERTNCKNCVVWAKSDSLARSVLKLSSHTTVGYIVMKNLSTGARMKLLRIRGAEVVGVYHPLIDEKLVKILHGRNKKVYAWTVDEEEYMQKMLWEGVDAVVTSNPSLFQRVMQYAKTQCFEQGFS